MGQASQFFIVLCLAASVSACCECDESHDDGGAGGQSGSTSTQTTTSSSSTISSSSSGGMMCTEPQADCDGDAANGCETNTSNDPANCGGCGVLCGVGTCVDSMCVTRELIVDGLATLGEIASDGTTLFFAGAGHAPNYVDGAIYSVPIAGGVQATVLASPIPKAETIVLERDAVVFTSDGTGAENFVDGYLARLPKAGGTPTVLAPGLPFAYKLLFHEGAYFVGCAGTYPTFVDGSIQLWDGATIESPVSGQSLIEAFTVLDGYVYWASRTMPMGTDGIFYRSPIAGGAPQTLAEGLMTASELATIDGHVYLAASDTIFTIDPEAPTTLVPFAPTNGTVAKIVSDGTHVYWTERGGRLMRKPLAGGTATVLDDQMTQAWGLWVGDTDVFYTERGTGSDDAAVFRIRK